MIRVLLLVPLVCLFQQPNPPTPLPSEGRGALSPSPLRGGVGEGLRQVQLNGHTFTLPDGFTIELVAGPKLAERPVVAAFDEKGRLYVCDSSGSNEPTKVQAEKKPHRIVRLTDTNGDGVFDEA